MAFLNSWAIAIGAVAASLPILVHWLTRPKPIALPLSTVRFVREVIRQRRARYRLRDFLILAVRVAAVVLVAAAMARPLTQRRAQRVDEFAGEATRVVLLDVSQSMAARIGGIEAFERARSMAAGHLTFRPGLSVNLILAGAAARAAFDRPSTNFAALRDELGKATPRPERLNVQTALARAARMFADTEKSKRNELVIVSDFQRAQWAAADFSVLPDDTVLQLEFVGAKETPPNLAVLRVGSAGRAEVGKPLIVEVDVGNYSPTARKIEVELNLAEGAYRLEGLCAAGAKLALSTEIIPRTPGWQTGTARLLAANDALAADDTRAFVVDVRSPPAFALVTRQAASVRPSSSYYLERALVPDEARDDRTRPRVFRFDPAQTDRESLAAADLVILDHPGRLPEDLLSKLVGWLRRGRGVLYVAGEPADAGNLKRLAELAGTDLRMPVEFAPPTAEHRAARFIADFRRDAPPFQIFGDELTAAFAPLRFSGGLVSRVLPDALADDVRASFGDRNACLVVSNCGVGVLAVLSADLEASNLPGSSVFVPLLGELTTVLLGRRGVEAPVPCGEPFALPLPVDAGPVARLAVAGDRGPEGKVELTEGREGGACRASAAGPPGVTTIRRDGKVVFALATAVPEQESDLTALPASVLQGRLLGDRRAYYREAGGPDEESDTLWAWLAVACVGCLATEIVLLRVFRT